MTGTCVAISLLKLTKVGQDLSSKSYRTETYFRKTLKVIHQKRRLKRVFLNHVLSNFLISLSSECSVNTHSPIITALDNTSS